MNGLNKAHPYELNVEIEVNILPAGRPPVQLRFAFGNGYATHPDHVRTYQGGFAGTFDAMVRSHILVAMNSLLNKIAQDHEAEAPRTDGKSPQPGATSSDRFRQFGSLNLSQDPPMEELPEDSSRFHVEAEAA